MRKIAGNNPAYVGNWGLNKKKKRLEECWGDETKMEDESNWN